jgi:C-terminal processing protease CtpA/Prc
MESGHYEGHMQLPTVVMEPDQRYKQRLRRVFSMHPMAGDKEFVRFTQVQLLWDEYMAESAADYLQKNSERKIIVLAGSGHMRGSSGIPERLSSRLSLDYAVLLSGEPADYVACDADLVIMADGLEFPKAGLLGIHIQEDETGVIVERVDSARKQGPGHLSVDDRIFSIAGELIRSMEDVRLALLDRLPGEQVWLELERNDELGSITTVSTYIELM